MFERLKAYLGDREKPHMANIILFGCLGVVMLIVASSLPGLKTAESSGNTATDVKGDSKLFKESGLSYEKGLEIRLKGLLGAVEGVGSVEIMITISNGAEIIMAEDETESQSVIYENDASGGTRQSTTTNRDARKILVPGEQGMQEPLVLKELKPSIQGVIIVAQGGGNVLVKEALINAATTALGIEPHKVQVFKMKSQ
jgi:stage III sporulation protein AG